MSFLFEPALAFLIISYPVKGTTKRGLGNVDMTSDDFATDELQYGIHAA